MDSLVRIPRVGLIMTQRVRIQGHFTKMDHVNQVMLLLKLHLKLLELKLVMLQYEILQQLQLRKHLSSLKFRAIRISFMLLSIIINLFIHSDLLLLEVRRLKDTHLNIQTPSS